MRIELGRDEFELVIKVIDNGVGVPDDFTVEGAKGLGLSIVRALVTSDLKGSIDLVRPVQGSGTEIHLHVPLSAFAN